MGRKVDVQSAEQGTDSADECRKARRAAEAGSEQLVAGRSRALNRAQGVGVGHDVKTAWAVHTQVLFAHVRPLVSYGVTCSETLPMRKLPTGEPYARCDRRSRCELASASLVRPKPSKQGGSESCGRRGDAGSEA